MLQRILPLALLAAITLSCLSGCGSSKATGNPADLSVSVKGKENKSGTRTVRPPE
jgi:hypothetical protein